MRRDELSEAQWQLLEDLLPENGQRGGQWKDHRQIVNGISWILRTGAPWRDLPERYGQWHTVYDRFTRWQQEGLFDRILERLQVRLDQEGQIDWDLCNGGRALFPCRTKTWL